MSKNYKSNSKNAKFNGSKTKKNDFNKARSTKGGSHAQKPNPKFMGKDDDRIRTTGQGNDPAWYMRNPEMARAAGNINYSDVLGLPVTLVSGGPGNNIVEEVNNNFPGLMVLRYVPGVGVSDNNASALNVNARLVYSYIRSWNSGSRNYEAPDLMMYLIAMSSLYTYYSEMVRVYGLFQVFSPENRYIAKPMIQALGFDYDDLSHNLASFRYYINSFAVRVNSLATPKSLTFYDRQAWMPLHVFKDAETIKAQHYAFVPDVYYQWTGTEYETGSALVPVYNSGDRTLEDIARVGDLLLESLLTDEDIGIMSGDIIKAFKDSGTRGLAALAENYATVPVYDQLVLSQIHNAYIMGDLKVDPDARLQEVDFLKDASITQENGAIIYRPWFENPGIPMVDNYGYYLNQVLDAPMKDPSVEYNLEATRLKPAFRVQVVDSDSAQFVQPEAIGSEVIVSATIFSLDENGDAMELSDLGNYVYDRGSGTIGARTVRAGIVRQYFDWSPITYSTVYQNDGEGVVTMEVWPEGELFNYTTVSMETLKKIHNSVQQSLFQIPEMVHPV